MGCVVSTASGGELLQAIRAVHQGRLALPCDVAEAFGAHGVQPTLTPRQVEVLQLIAAGLRNADISTRLQISQQTVKSHVRAILARLNARDRTQALSIGIRHGIVHVEP